MRAPFVITARGHLIEKPLTEIEKITSYIESAMISFIGINNLYSKLAK